ncbi:MAG TPA: hypothetical protein PKD64_06235 [Pirellulaceae bacterium]|nr:hypothetical protein [Pirellulaceae bacterium]HMO91779.1 hypothetical protein [Pirellulaceae bacterium]HMP69578.1 hypothetical protein [Pirellulaceae bacterium]
MKFLRLLLTLMATLSINATRDASAQEVSLFEELALAENREQALALFIPGTEDYFYAHALHYQHTEQFEKVESLLKDWIRQHGQTDLVTQIQNRQALLRYTTGPSASLNYLRRYLALAFNHEREIPNSELVLPDTLDPDVIAYATLLTRALAQANDLSQVEDAGLNGLADKELSPHQLRHLLSRISLPDLPNLPELIVRDLRNFGERAFGSDPIHSRLTLAQLDQLEQLLPDILNQKGFVDSYLARLRPDDDTNWARDIEQKQIYLLRLRSFVERLGTVHNSLKANVLYQQLQLNLQQQIYDKELLIKYLALPRDVHYANREYFNREARTQAAVNLNDDFSGSTALRPIGNDEPLVREHLAHFLKSAENFKEFLPWVDNNYLQRLFAETKIVNGLGEVEAWIAMLTPEEYQALMTRVDLDFPAWNKTNHNVDETVEIELYTKNVSKLIVKVYEINTEVYYQSLKKEIATDINLDGLVANWEELFSYDDPPVRRMLRKFTFDQLNQRGVYVIDFIGNGKSSRVIVRKGQLHHVVETTFAGQMFAVLDEENRPVNPASIWMEGRQFASDENGFILLPFTTRPTTQPIVLVDNNRFCSLASFKHQAETYSLKAGFYVDRETLLRGERSRLVLRPQLLIGALPTSLKSLQDVKLTISSTDHEGISSYKEISELELREDQESIIEFQVPDRLNTLTFTLQGKVHVASRGEDQTLTVSESFQINQIDKTQHITDVFFVDGENGYRFEVRGKTGEPRLKYPINVELKHRLFKETIRVSLQTNEHGFVQLGELPDIDSVAVRLSSDVVQHWPVHGSKLSQHAALHVEAGQPVHIAIPLEWTEVTPAHVALFEMRAGQYYANRFESLRWNPGLLTIEGLMPGNYRFVFKGNSESIKIRVSAGVYVHGHLVNQTRKLEMSMSERPWLTSVTTDATHVSIQVAGATPHTRVHLIATRFVPRFDVYNQFHGIRDAELTGSNQAAVQTLYVAGRNLGDELRYILDRQHADKFPGNSLTRPSLLLNPWAIRDTDTADYVLSEGSDFLSAPTESMRGDSAARKRQQAEDEHKRDLSNLDYLAEPSVLFANLIPDKNGVVAIERARLGNRHLLHIVLVDASNIISTFAKIEESKFVTRDLRLANGLDPQKHFLRGKSHKLLSPGESFTLENPLTSDFQTFDTLADVYRLFMAMTGNSTLNEFSFVVNWHNQTEEDKRALYTKFACHELHLFLRHKDPAFFDEVVKPYLSQKRDKTFLDYFLLGSELDNYINSWQFDQLNTVERALLSKRLGDRRSPLVQLINHQYDLAPINQLESDRAFGFIFATGQLDKSLLSEEKSKLRAGLELNQAYAREHRDAEDEKGEAMERRAGRGFFGDDAAPGRRLRSAEGFGGGGFGGISPADVPGPQRGFYRRLKPTQEWAENNYYKLLNVEQLGDLLPMNRFWRDYANHAEEGGFRSPFFAEASGSFTEMMLALALLDLPFSAEEHAIDINADRLEFKAASHTIAFYQQVSETAFDRADSNLLVSENFFRNDDRYLQRGDQRFDKFIKDEFLIDTVYGGQLVVTNPTSTPQRIEVLVQLPVGSLPVLGSQITRTHKIDLAAFSTQTLEYHFYFPLAGKYQHFPAHVCDAERVIAVADGFEFTVVDRLSTVDRSSWAYISQYGSDDDVLDFLTHENLLAVDVSKIAFRMKDKSFFDRVLALLRQHFIFNPTLWSYGILHNEPQTIREYLSRHHKLVNSVGSYLHSPLLEVDPVDSKLYEHLEYWPLVNARAHQIGARRRILNSALHQQYHRFLKYLVSKPDRNSYDHLAVTYYLLLQDRISEAQKHFAKVDPVQLESRLHYDYCAAYLAMSSELPEQARQIAALYSEYPVNRWRDLFANIVAQVDEIDTGTTKVVDQFDQAQMQSLAAAATPSFEFSVTQNSIDLIYRNIESVQVRIYLMDIELLFSRNPFVSQQTEGFALIRPNFEQLVKLDGGKSTHKFDLPKEFDNRNVLIEISDGNRGRSLAHYANSLRIMLAEDFGELRVSHRETNKPLSKVYVKVYAMKADGSPHFYKDGYTDLRGRFDYTSLSDQSLDDVQRFSILIMSEQFGAVIREAAAPKE